MRHARRAFGLIAGHGSHTTDLMVEIEPSVGLDSECLFALHTELGQLWFMDAEWHTSHAGVGWVRPAVEPGGTIMESSSIQGPFQRAYEMPIPSQVAPCHSHCQRQSVEPYIENTHLESQRVA